MLRKPRKLERGDAIAIISLSSGVLGESFVKHQLDLGTKRIREFGLHPVFMKNSLKGIDYISQYPSARADDLKQAFSDSSIKAVICSIGGDDTYKTIPYLMNDHAFKNSVRENPKIFSGFSDSTINHLMFYKLGMQSFYGPSFLTDLAELSNDMLPYTKEYFSLYLSNRNNVHIKSSPIWYHERDNFSAQSLGIPRKSNREKYGHDILYGTGIVRGSLLGGCLQSIYASLTGNRYPDQADVMEKYHIIPNQEEWYDKVLFIETSEERLFPYDFKKMLRCLVERKIWGNVKAIMVGKPQNEIFYNEYRNILLDLARLTGKPIIYNVNFGHSYPRTILPYGIKTEINFDTGKISIIEPWFK
ncbi:LD-carboxypeptidase [Saccharibacter sp. 17.LH.SD]|uniref:S66 family peptidase n=1 Tax=Saccharibacter sp. 17.LH.SD TaxID=2689393 RepID=UPI001369504E|nr:S66 peptidase family protein [Saccharibacter sp. 17.LH.SD]MXV44337.1 LD-carboxypeptidase [Saccharibacter sp. 17.LH.SD]